VIAPFTQSRTVCWSCLLAVAGEVRERVRLGAGWARVGAGRGCSPKGAENDSSADKQFRDHFQRSFHFSSLVAALLRAARLSVRCSAMHRVNSDVPRLGDTRHPQNSGSCPQRIGFFRHDPSATPLASPLEMAANELALYAVVSTGTATVSYIFPGYPRPLGAGWIADAVRQRGAGLFSPSPSVSRTRFTPRSRSCWPCCR
jgi:hypothetical protein